MLAFACEWCQRPKRHGEHWVLAFAAERTGISGLQREISVAAEWSDACAAHPLAVHFCSEKHKQAYITALVGDSGRRRSGRSANVPKARRGGKRKPSFQIKFTTGDEIHSRGLGVRLDDLQA